MSFNNLNLIEQLCKTLYTNKIIQLNIIRDSEDDFIINQNGILDNGLVHLYAKIVNDMLSLNNIDTIISSDEPITLVLNSFLSYSYNYNLGIIKLKDISKKASINIDISDNIETIGLPICFYPTHTSTINKYIAVIKLLKKFKPKRICIITFCCINITGSELFMNNIVKLSCPETTVYIEKIIDKSLFLDKIDSLLLYSEKIFINNTIQDSDEYPLINLYSLKNTSISENSVFKRFVSISESKKTRVCLDIEYIISIDEMIKYCNTLGPYIAAIKINSNNIYNYNVLTGIKRLSKHHNFIIIDDKKACLNNINNLNSIGKLFDVVDCTTISIDVNLTDKIIMDYLESFLKRYSNIGLILDYQYESIERLLKNHVLLNRYIFGIIGVNTKIRQVNSIIEYNLIKKNTKLLKYVDMVIIGKELYEYSNPIDIIKKINEIQCV